MERFSIIRLGIIAYLLFTIFINVKGETLFLKETISEHKSIDTTEFLNRYKELDKYYSDKKLGSYVESGKTYFALFAPSAIQVKLCLFTKPEETSDKEFQMKKDENGVWEISFDKELYGKFYGYKVYHTGDDLDNYNMPICVDPYSKAVASFTTYMNPRRSIVVKEHPYNWENTNWIQRDWRDLIIYEMHIRDVTEDKSSGVKSRGTYDGLTEKGKKGGLSYIKSLGVNTVELLPAQEYGNIEIPYETLMDGKLNTWNPYERNHWGYMTSNFFAPAAYYNQRTNELKWNRWIGEDGSQIDGFKNMVRAFHKEGIGVIMDVVYNHLSEYEIGNLKQIDKEYYFRLDNKGNFIAESYCGNDLKTERPMVRRLIVESLLYWMKEYHVDGFRFDLGKLIDWQTIDEITKETKKINPNVILVCEPWGGGYDPHGFSMHGWGAWNDQIRNGIKGENPKDGLGWIFGNWYGNNSIKRIMSYVNGTLSRDSLGLFEKKEHSVNYLESHDGYTLGDFIRIGSREVDPTKKIKNVDSFVKLSSYQLRLNKLAAIFLMTSQGITMISEGQEFARTKVISTKTKVKDPDKGLIDHNSYNKDNATNYLNYKHAAINKNLLDYYKGLIAIRNNYDAFRRANYEDVNFINTPENKFALAYSLNYGGEKFIVVFNADQQKELEFDLPDGTWEVLADKDTANPTLKINLHGRITLEAISGIILRLKS